MDALLINGYTDDFGVQDLFLAISPDLQTWTFHREPLLAHDEPDLDLYGLYRSTGFVAGDRLVVWYSHQYRE